MNQLLNNALTVETPGKIMGLVGAAMFSLAFMLAVSVSDASFTQTYSSISDPFSMENVVATIDNAAANYDKFLYANLFQPAEETYQVYADNISWVADNSGVTYALGFSEQPAKTSVGKVAGASTLRYNTESKSGGVLNLIYEAITQ